MVTSVQERERYLAEYQASGLTQVQFAEQAGIKVETLRAWIYRGPTKQAPQERRRALLDAIGDLYIVGHPLLAAFSAHKSGHALNNQLLRALLADASAWEWASYARVEDAPGRVAHLYPQAA